MMCQQTTVAAVVPKFLTWMERFPTIEVLAKAELDLVLSHWSGLGYYQRARRLHRAAQSIVEMGEFPNSFESLKQLPGFGPYTAAAVASISFGEATLAIDTNVIRVLYRYFALEGDAQDKKLHQVLREKVSSSWQVSYPGDFNQSLMELGASLCSVKTPNCRNCPLKSSCIGRKSTKGPTSYPSAKQKKAKILTRGVALLIELQDKDSLLLVRGTSLGLLKDLYQPPILFLKEGQEHPIDRVVRPFIPNFQGLNEPKFSCVKYLISSRRLQLETFRIQLDEVMWKKLFEDLQKQLSLIHI